MCDEPRTEPDGSRHFEKWFVDCKHFKKGVPPKELRNLLAWSEAERPAVALFAVSNFLSNPAKDYLESCHRNNKGALRGQRAAEKRFGRKSLMDNMKTDWDWGFVSGKLSALRWVLGDEWDMLDT